MPDISFLDWPFLEDRHRDFARRLDAWAASTSTRTRIMPAMTSMPPAARWPRSSAPPAGWPPPCRRTERGARPAHAVPRPRDAGAPFRPRRFRLRHAGPGQRRRSPCSAAPAMRARHPARRARGPQPRRLRAVRARRRLGCRRACHHGRPRARRLAAGRDENLDQQRRHRRALRGVRPHRRGAGRARPVGLPGRGRHARAERHARASR